MAIREQERSSIARELHDELGQALTRLNIDVTWLTQQLPARLRTRRVAAMGPLVDRTIRTVQQISSQLRPPILDDLGLEAAIEWHVQEFAEWSGCRCELNLRIGAMPKDRDRDIAIFRILQEALTNVARHARAEIVKVRADPETTTSSSSRSKTTASASRRPSSPGSTRMASPAWRSAPRGSAASCRSPFLQDEAPM